jgi:hypothetical protein
MLELEFTLTVEDYESYFYFVNWSAPSRKKFRTRFYLRYIIIFAFVLIASSNIFSAGEFQWEVFAPVVVIMAIIFFVIPQYSIKSTYTRLARSVTTEPGGKTAFLGKKRAVFTEQGMTYSGELSETKTSWKAFVRKEENKGSIYLYIASRTAHIIPKSAFSSEEQVEAFRKYLLQYLPLQAEFPNH